MFVPFVLLHLSKVSLFCHFPGILNKIDFSNHPQWNYESGWKNTLNNLRLIIQPLLLFWLIY
ncbi:MAG: hypothetical protein RMY35_027250, partial [Nostoc sp. DedSLP01]